MPVIDLQRPGEGTRSGGYTWRAPVTIMAGMLSRLYAAAFVWAAVCADKPKQQMAVMEHNYEWFSKYIWGEQTGIN